MKFIGGIIRLAGWLLIFVAARGCATAGHTENPGGTVVVAVVMAMVGGGVQSLGARLGASSSEIVN